MIESLDPRHIEATVAAWAAPGERLHPLPLKTITLAPEALDTLPELLEREGFHDVMIVSDETPKARGGGDVNEAVIARLGEVATVHHLVLDEPVHADLATAQRLSERLVDLDLVVAVGSGSVTDLVKYARHLKVGSDGPALPFLSIPTAASVTAFTSALSVLLIDGVKRTLPSAPPEYVIADGAILAGAPRAMTLAGFGDVLARSVSYGDWYLAARLGMAEGYSEVPGKLLEPSESRMIAAAADLARGDVGAVMQVMEALLLAGLAMSLVNQTSPLSGWEHVISHFLDMTAAHDRRSMALHGEQVGVGTLIAARAYEQAWPELDPDRLLWQPSDYEVRRALGRIRRAFRRYDRSGEMAAEIERDAARKLQLWQETVTPHRDCRQAWQAGRLESALKRLTRPAAEIEAALVTAGAPTRFEDLTQPISHQSARAALRLGHLIRARFTLGDLLELGGWLNARHIEGLLDD